jgi:hypothetical protein
VQRLDGRRSGLQRALRQLDLERLGRQRVLAQNGFEAHRECRIVELLGRKVHRHHGIGPSRRAPLRGALDRGFQHPFADFLDQPGALRDGEELSGHQQSAIGVPPANQHLDRS